MRLHTYFRSSAAYRVRIALALKGLDVETVPVHLLRAGGAQNTPDFRRLNPMGAVPVLEEGNAVLTQSLAIIEYLDEAYPAPPLLPIPLLERARVRAIAQTIACDIHPLNNLRVLNYLTQEVGAGETARKAWTRHWITRGLEAVEQLLVNSANTGAFCHGDTPGLADCCLVPQVFNARRFDCPIDHLPTVLRVVETCQHHPAIAAARPEAQPDWEDPTN